jgi:aerobic-type carbon monoxide dehydrogenase small subunit (CoxS/CutS family)
VAFRQSVSRADERLVLHLTVNGETRDVLALPSATLLEVLREDLDLTGTKHGCELGECGLCTVLVDQTPLFACLLLAVEMEEREIVTVEGLADGSRLAPLQEAFRELGAAQCGYCTPGMLMASTHLLATVAHPTQAQIREALSGNLCRCTGYSKIVDAVAMAARRIGGEDG